jgi:asparagine synthase (glutamine-hydrolysing)
MASIAGMAGSNGHIAQVVAMLDLMQHRGPDTRNLYEQDDICAGVQAAALSPARGQGIASADGVTVLLDGDLYNPREPGQSDADVALGLYKRYGMTFAGHLEGVFAVAVIEGDHVLLARDTVGVRPLYRGATSHGDLCFASEMKALVGVSEDVTELLPATTFSSARGVAGYVPTAPVVTVPDVWQDAAAALRDCLMRAVERRLEDGAVGACLLSGGLDSSIIAAAVKALGSDMPLLTVGYEGGAPDVDYAKVVAEHLGMQHEIRIFSAADIEELVPRAVRTMESFDEDCVSGTLSNLFASDLARQTTNCILSGEGGDELFGGYHLLKDVPSESGRLRMMQRLVAIAYNTAVQRLDRSMMSNAIHYRTPFIDTEVMAFAAHLPVDWKIHRLDDGLMEKWLLREAFKDLLPDVIYKRSKLRFSGGTGTDNVMDEIARRHLADGDFNDATRHTSEGYVLNSPKELWYYRLFKEHFPAPCFERLVGRWDPGK